MGWKLAVLVLALGATACGLLVLRQQELDLLAARTDLRREIIRKQQLLQSLRWELDELSRDRRLADWMARQDIDLMPLDFEPRFEDANRTRPGRIALDGVDAVPERGG